MRIRFYHVGLLIPLFVYVALEEIHSHPSLSFHFRETAYQISERNFFQVGDDVTTRDFEIFPIRITYFAILLSQFALHCITCLMFE
ncbi:hypothetical protein Hanom_Chr13g01238211 [Helianthus anomalus]